MKNLRGIILVVFMFSLLLSGGVSQALSYSPGTPPPSVQAVTDDDEVEIVTGASLGENEVQINAATSEEFETVSRSGTLIEIGNTTAANTTIIVRVQQPNATTTEDITLEIDEKTNVISDADLKASLSDWIAGDPISFTARHYTNSGTWVAIRVKNTAFKTFHRGINGWITAIRPSENKIDVTWEGTIYTLNLADAKMVAGLKNPATINDLQIGDRVRARVVSDADANRLTWDAKILVVLRRGNSLFMRITRWVIPAKITMIPATTTLPTTIEVEVQPSKFFQQGDVNNLIGAPGTKVMVDITQNTLLVRRYLGRALLSEFSEGDNVRIIGRRDESTGHVVAQFIKNDSIQRLGVGYFVGRVTAADSATLKLTAEVYKLFSRPTWTVNTGASTIFYRNGKLSTFADIKAGDLIRVRGTANTTQKAVTANVVAVIGLSASQ